jgi:hypothetical protein
MIIYLVGSLRNPEIPKYADMLRNEGHEVFDDWFAAGPTADDSWQEYEKTKGVHYDEALQSWAARHVFEFDKYHLNRCDAVVLVMPAGKSGHLELGYGVGIGKKAYVLFDREPDRWDVMYAFANGVAFDINTLIKLLKE